MRVDIAVSCHPAPGLLFLQRSAGEHCYLLSLCLMHDRLTQDAWGTGFTMSPGICPAPYLLIVDAVKLGQDDLHTVALLLHSASQRRDDITHTAHLHSASACSQAPLGHAVGCSSCGMAHCSVTFPGHGNLVRYTDGDRQGVSEIVQRCTLTLQPSECCMSWKESTPMKPCLRTSILVPGVEPCQSSWRKGE